MDKNILLSSFGKWVAPLNAKLILEWASEAAPEILQELCVDSLNTYIPSKVKHWY